jgi:hypothetical protein
MINIESVTRNDPLFRMVSVWDYVNFTNFSFYSSVNWK